MKIGFIGDIHGEHKRPALSFFLRESGVDICVSTGDLQDYRGEYGVPLTFIRGNHECWAIIDEMISGEHTPLGLTYLPDLVPLALDGVRLIGLGGAWTDRDSQARRHLTSRQVEKLLHHRADIVLSHETPITFANGRLGMGGQSRTCAPLREACRRLSPRFWFSGHHHHYDVEQLGRTTIISLGKWPHEWGVVEVENGQMSEFVRFSPIDRFAYEGLLPGWREDEQIEKEILLPIDHRGGRYGLGI